MYSFVYLKCNLALIIKTRRDVLNMKWYNVAYPVVHFVRISRDLVVDDCNMFSAHRAFESLYPDVIVVSLYTIHFHKIWINFIFEAVIDLLKRFWLESDVQNAVRRSVMTPSVGRYTSGFLIHIYCFRGILIIEIFICLTSLCLFLINIYQDRMFPIIVIE